MELTHICFFLLGYFGMNLVRGKVADGPGEVVFALVAAVIWVFVIMPLLKGLFA